MQRRLLRIVKKTVLALLTIAAPFAVVIFLYMRKEKFGKMPGGERLSKLKLSPNYKNGAFQNINPTPQLAEGYSMSGVLYAHFFKRTARRSPAEAIPSTKTDLHHLPPDANVLVWFGHSSYYLQLHGKRILVDPVFSGNASPIPGTTRSYKGTDRYTVADLPDIDYLFISHDHYDHLDYETIVLLKAKVKKVICGLGVGAHFEHWGYPSAKIIEKDWNEETELDSGFKVNIVPARHFSGRTFARNNTLWASYVLQSGNKKIYIGGDSGYDTHFKEIGNNFGPIDLAILENGQYNLAWPNIHMQPEEVLKAGSDLKAKRVFPVHSSKFSLANHSWDEPLVRISELAKTSNFPLITPIIGEVVNLDDTHQAFKQWWVGIK